MSKLKIKRYFKITYLVMKLLQTLEDSMSELEKGMVSIIQIFHKYSGHKCKLKKAELKDLINNEMSTFIKVSQTNV